MEISGRIKKIFEVQTFSSGFQKKEMVVTTQEQYPQDIIIEFLQDKITLLDAFNIGDEVKVSINIRGREWINPEGVAKYFNSINGWRIEKIGTTMPEDGEMTNLPPDAGFALGNDSEPDDLPF